MAEVRLRAGGAACVSQRALSTSWAYSPAELPCPDGFRQRATSGGRHHAVRAEERRREALPHGQARLVRQATRPHVRHTLVVPGPRHAYDGNGRLSIYAAPLPFADGYRFPLGKTAWMKRLMRQRPTLIEAGDPYTPGLAAQRAGEALGVPVVGFCHTDLAALAAAHIGDWAEKPIRRHWGEIYRRFDRVVAPSRFIAERLADAGVDDPIALPLGVDVEAFRPDGADRAPVLRRRLGLSPHHRLLVFAGRPAREKRVEVLVEAVERLGDPYVLLLVGARAATPSPGRVIELPYETDPGKLAALMASCDAFVHANDSEPFGLIVLEAMACGLPVVGVAAGGVGESVDQAVGELAIRSTGPDFADAVEALFERDLAPHGLRGARLRSARLGRRLHRLSSLCRRHRRRRLRCSAGLCSGELS